MDGALTMDRASMRDDERLVTISVVETIIEASIARGALESVGIRALVPEETLVRLGRSWGTSLIPTGSLQVLESDEARAVADLRRRQIPHRAVTCRGTV